MIDRQNGKAVVQKAFARGLMALLREYNSLRGDGNTGGAEIAFEDVCKCKVSWWN